MDNYLNNNIILISEYEKLYSDSIKIADVVNKFRNDYFDKYTAFDYGRFRVFIDSCLLLFNKEKLNKYIKDGYSYADFFYMVEQDSTLKSYLSYIRTNPIFSDVKKPCVFFSVKGKEKGAWDQVATIRNAFAHMQYGNFCFEESGLMIYYGIYNKDKGIKKDEGIVFEPVLHEFVKGYFSNYSFGIPFKTCFFMKYSLKNKHVTDELIFYEITAKQNINKKYDGYSQNAISDLIKQFGNSNVDIVSYICNNISKYNINEFRIDEKISIDNFNKCVEIYQLNKADRFYYGLKVFLDFETEISNFLVHMGQLNDILYEYSVLKKCGNYTKTQIDKIRAQFEKRIEELSEDESAILAFEIGFSYLKILNFVLRTEDDDYGKIDYSLVNVHGFIYSDELLKKYIEDNKISDSPIQKYIVERVRNSLMHGNICCEVTEKGEVLINFVDIFNKREEVIKILLEDLKTFLGQKTLYSGVPIQTEVLLMQKTE